MQTHGIKVKKIQYANNGHHSCIVFTTDDYGVIKANNTLGIWCLTYQEKFPFGSRVINNQTLHAIGQKIESSKSPKILDSWSDEWQEFS